MTHDWITLLLRTRPRQSRVYVNRSFNEGHQPHQVLADIHSLQLPQRTLLCRKALERVRRHVELLALLQLADGARRAGSC